MVLVGEDVNLLDHVHQVIKLKKLAGRATLVQARTGNSAAEQMVHLALLEAALLVMERPGQGTKQAAVFKLVVSVAKTATGAVD